MPPVKPHEEARDVAADVDAPVEARVAAIEELARQVGPEISDRAALWQDVLSVLLFDESDDDAVRIAAAHAAATCGGVVVNNLCRSTSPHKPAIRRAIVSTLQEIGRQPVGDEVEPLMGDLLARLEDGLTLLPFLNLTLSFGADRRILPVVRSGLVDEQPQIRGSAVFQLAQMGEMEPAIHALASDPDPDVRAEAADAIAYYWTGEAEPIAALQHASGDEDTKVVKAAKSALRRLHLSELPEPPAGDEPTAAPSIEIDPRFRWSELLGRWSRELCEYEDFVLTQDDAVIESGWTGSNPVDAADLLDLERRLGRTLPPSYRAFLMTTDGYVGGGSVERIRPAREVRPFVEEESEWVEVWLATAGDGPPMSVADHVASRGRDEVIARWQLLSDAIQVSDTFDGAVYLLCPPVADDDGEWEAWLFANWLPGAARFASWWDLINEEYRNWQRD